MSPGRRRFPVGTLLAAVVDEIVGAVEAAV